MNIVYHGTRRTRARRVAEVSRFKTKKCNAIGYRVQKPGLPIGAAADFCALFRDFRPLVANCETTCQLFQRLLTSRHLFSTTFISVHIFLTLFSSLSSPLNAFELVLTHLTSVPPVLFLLSTVEVTQLQTFLFRPVELDFHSIMAFNIRLCSCYHSRVM